MRRLDGGGAPSRKDTNDHERREARENSLDWPQAGFDPDVGAPRCASAAASCDSGTLLNGSYGTVGGLEPNYPNTIDACPEPPGYAYHESESIDRLVITSLDGAPLTAGKSVKIDAVVYGLGGDSLDFYSAADAMNPTWIPLDTHTIENDGKQIVSIEHTLPTGHVQAIRAVLRFEGEPSTCMSGLDLFDTDDLVFTVTE